MQGFHERREKVEEDRSVCSLFSNDQFFLRVGRAAGAREIMAAISALGSDSEYCRCK
jgi:hypothetical protein